MKRLSIFLTTIMLSVQAHAGEIYENYNGIRAMGMGGAAVATVNDETSLLINPAGLGKLRDYFITVFDPEIEISSKTSTTTGTDVAGVLNPQKALEKATRTPDTHMHQRMQVFPSIVVPNFGLGVLGKYVVDARLDTATNQFIYDYTNDYQMVLGFDFRLFDGILKIGATARAVSRTEVRREDIDPGTTGMTLTSLATQGMGVASDVGMLLTVPVAWLPTLGVVYRDVGRTSYTFRGGLFGSTATPPNSTPETVDVGLSLNPILSNRGRMTFTAQYNDVLTYSQETSQMRRVHAGFEYNYADAFFLRAGMNQRYWTAGMELAIINYQFQIASYGEDIGTADAPKEDRRYMMKFSFRF